MATETMNRSEIKRWADGPEVREWALTLTDKEKKRYGIEGIEVSERGRFHSSIVRAFNRAHRDEGVGYVPISRHSPRLPEVFEERYQEDDEPEVYRQEPRTPKEEKPTPPSPRTPQDETPQPMVMAMGAAPAPIMELLQAGQNVIVVYVPLPVNAA